MKTSTETQSDEALMEITSKDEALQLLKFGCIEGNLTWVRSALDFGLKKVDIDKPSPQARTFLGRWFSTLLVAYWPEERSALKYYPLHHAARVKNPEKITEYCAIIELLTKGYNADPNVRNYMNNTPLHVAIYNKKKKTALALVASNADVNAQNSPSKMINLYNWFAQPSHYEDAEQTPLHYIVKYYPDIELLRALVKGGANVDLEDAAFKSPLVLAEESNHSELVEIMNKADTEVSSIPAYNNNDPNLIEEFKLRGALALSQERNNKHDEKVYSVMLANLYVTNPQLLPGKSDEKALELYNKALAIDPTYLPALNNKIYCECALGQVSYDEYLDKTSSLLESFHLEKLTELLDKIPQDLRVEFKIPQKFIIEAYQNQNKSDAMAEVEPLLLPDEPKESPPSPQEPTTIADASSVTATAQPKEVVPTAAIRPLPRGPARVATRAPDRAPPPAPVAPNIPPAPANTLQTYTLPKSNAALLSSIRGYSTDQLRPVVIAPRPVADPQDAVAAALQAAMDARRKSMNNK